MSKELMGALITVGAVIVGLFIYFSFLVDKPDKKKTA
jgi:hypothetical protein